MIDITQVRVYDHSLLPLSTQFELEAMQRNLLDIDHKDVCQLTRNAVGDLFAAAQEAEQYANAINKISSIDAMNLMQIINEAYGDFTEFYEQRPHFVDFFAHYLDEIDVLDSGLERELVFFYAMLACEELQEYFEENSVVASIDLLYNEVLKEYTKRELIEAHSRVESLVPPALSGLFYYDDFRHIMYTI